MNKVAIDTNIAIFLIRNKKFRQYFEQKYPQSSTKFLLCFATETESKSFSFRKSWGEYKCEDLKDLFKIMEPIRYINDEMIQAYTEIEAYTLCQHPTRPKPDGQTAHRMGKNDLWIAATTAVYAQRLITTDKDFLQLDGVFFAVDYIDIAHF